MLVKLVDPECYGKDVHRILAHEGFAPSLLGTAEVPGAPTAIVMEYLDPSSGWMTLHSYLKKRQRIEVNTKHPELVKLLKTMKEKEVVHGDLRPNNIMCRLRPDKGAEADELEFKVVDFDWAGKLKVAKYPAIMNSQIPWPGDPGASIGEGDDETLLTKTLKMV